MADDPTRTLSERGQDRTARDATPRPATRRWIARGWSSKKKLAAAVVACGAPTLALILLPAASVFPAFWFMLTVVMITAWTGRRPGLLAVAVSLVAIGSLVRPPHVRTNTGLLIFPLWLLAIGGGLTAAVLVVDTVLRRAVAAETARRELLETATRSAEALDLSESLVRGAPVGMCVLDADLRYVLVNEQLARITGVPVAEHHGRRVAEVTPELGAQADAYLRKLLDTGTPTTAVTLAGADPTDPADPDGERRRWVLSCYPIAGPVGSSVVLGMTVQEITDELRLRRELERTTAAAELAHRLAASHRLARLGAWEFDQTAGSVRLSPELASIIGVPAGPATIPDIRALLHPDDTARLEPVVAGVIGGGESFTADARIIRADGVCRQLAVFGEPIRGSASGPPFTSLWGVVQDVTDLRSAQRSAAEARSEWAAEHRLLERFQRALLPSELPQVPGAELAAAYLAATDRLDIGGDWYDALRLPDGRIFLSVGDVAGHDQEAAARMGVVRAAIRAYAIEDPLPDAVLSRLNRFLAADDPRGRFITTLAMLYDPPTARLTWANAGHPAPMLADGRRGPAGRVTVLDDHDVALGLSGCTYSRWTVTVPRGSVLCLYTDGLVERRGSDPDVDEERLVRALGRAAVAAAKGPASPARARRLVDTVIADMLGAESPADDVCLVALLR